MNSVRIVADSGCDLTPELVSRYEITVVPCFVRFGQDMVSDDTMGVEEFWRRAAKLEDAPGTAGPPPGAFQMAYQRLISAGHDVLCLTLPKQQSSVYNSAWLGALEFGPDQVRVVDSRSISLGMGVQVIEAAKRALSGASLEAVQRAVENLRDRTSVIFVLDTLEWVRRGGRLDRMMPLIEKLARTFHVKPIVEMVDGDLRLLGVARSYKGALSRLEEEVRSRLPVELLATVYTRGRDAATDLVDRLAGMINVAPADIMLQEAGPVFATHTGPNALGAIVVRAERP
jgi:DegV family protein with EDD domain